MKNSKIAFHLIVFASFLLFGSCNDDENAECATNFYYYDGDGDGYGDRSISVSECVQPASYVTDGSDPDDTDAAVTPICDKTSYYEDADQDGFGNPGEVRVLCVGATVPDGFITNNEDCDDEDADVNPGIQDIFYEDKDQDGFGDPGATITQVACPLPDGYVRNNLDCDDNDDTIFPGMTVYQDSDGDGYGDPQVSIELEDCSDLNNGYVIDSTDCDDTDANINIGEDEIPGDEIDNNCDGISGIVWDGEEIEFSKETYAPWSSDENQDYLTDNVTFTRQDAGPIYNYTWWQNNFGTDATHSDGEASDLAADFTNDISISFKDITEINPTGGTKGVLWTLLDDTGANNPNSSWDSYQLYGSLGNPEHFHSFRNLVSIITSLENNSDVLLVADDFTIISSVEDEVEVNSDVDMSALVGKKLGLWLVDDDIYLTLTFTKWDAGKENPGGAFSYTRSTPSSED
ncbi:putative metal-binding motif-containing protein [Flagellimonas sp. 2504JD4-2]